ncbi:MAG: LysR family transcriptional regulator [Curvibacter lanceolatus]|uniref:LysR family transcriptional regulator n=1 Tax=Curvibacter lanceolatus TaxID=86182 RepID=UPI000368823F|nr:LysR family transcriptional regulator [Curvibacter lanceolatus]MBV5291675.1 LysR family transcriptional regulator [Curvibacter lanceolatus]
MDKLKAMQTFVQIADAGSLSAAARAQGGSLPAVVRTLALYEAHLGVRLFNRSTRRISLTPDGRQHLASCRQLLGAVAEAEAALREGATQPTGTLTVTAPVLFGQLHVAPAVTRFVQQHPQLQCRVVLLDRVVNLLEEGFDMGLRIGHLDDSSLVARALGEVRRPVVASPAYLARVGQPQHPRDLQQANCIHRIDGRNAWGPFQEHGRLFDVEVSGQLAFNHNAPAVAACVLGGGFGQFFSYQVAAELQRGELVEVLQDFQGPPTPVQVVYPHARLLPVRARLFIDWMRQELAGFAPEAAPQA